MSAAVYANITQEQRKLLSNLSLSNEYVVEIKLPDNLKAFLTNPVVPDPNLKKKIPPGLGLTIDENQLSLLCADASLPGSTFATTEVKDNFLGVTQEFAHTRLYTDIDLTFYVDSRYKILELFHGWNDYISGGAGNKVAQNNTTGGFYRRFRYPDNYKSLVNIAKLERDYKFNNYSRTYTLVNAFPKSIASVPLSYGPADILKITVTFNYDRYIIDRSFQEGGPRKQSPSAGDGSQPTGETSTNKQNSTSGRPISPTLRRQNPSLTDEQIRILQETGRRP